VFRGGESTVLPRVIERGAQAIVHGCAEISLLLRQSDVAIPLIDTIALHAEVAVEFALGSDSAPRYVESGPEQSRQG
jgi:aspartate racemase